MGMDSLWHWQHGVARGHWESHLGLEGRPLLDPAPVREAHHRGDWAGKHPVPTDGYRSCGDSQPEAVWYRADLLHNIDYDHTGTRRQLQACSVGVASACERGVASAWLMCAGPWLSRVQCSMTISGSLTGQKK